MRHDNKKVDQKGLFLLLITLVASRHCKSATSANPVPDCDFVWLVMLLKRDVTAVCTIATLMVQGFTIMMCLLKSVAPPINNGKMQLFFLPVTRIQPVLTYIFLYGLSLWVCL